MPTSKIPLMLVVDSPRQNRCGLSCGRQEGVHGLHLQPAELKRKKQNGLVLKLDFEKAYDKVNWKFLLQVHRMRGFPSLWCQWIENVISKGSVGVQINDELGHFFKTRKGLRQGDPLSPILFNLVAHMLAVLIERAKSHGFIDGLVPHLVDDGLSILQYTDDAILFIEVDPEKEKGLRLVLSAFEKLSS
jgi:retron-type reverse transcriptase